MYTKFNIRSSKRSKFRSNEQIGVRQRLQGKLDKIALTSFRTPYDIYRPKILSTPLILNSPHSGNHYPEDFLAQANLTKQQLRQSEDCYVDEIIRPLTNYGVPLVAAKFPRIYVDLNRSADEWPPESIPNTSRAISPRARVGLGVVPTSISADLDIYPHPISADLIRARLDMLYHPYHQALADLIQTTKATFGDALLLDCHSMPGYDLQGQARADIVLGNCHGDSCHPKTINFIESVFANLGYKTALNYPYAGGFITNHYGRPNENIEAVQIEINKNLYLDATTLKPHAGMKALANNMQSALLQIKDFLDIPTSIAAE